MSILNKHIAFVNEQLAVQEKLISKFGPDSKLASNFRYSLHVSSAEKFRETLADIEQADKLLDSIDTTKPIIGARNNQFQLFPSDITDLPEELIAELSVQQADKLEFSILAVMEESKGLISLDKLLVGLYKKTNEIHKRTGLTAKLYRMSQKRIVFSVPTKKGIYSLAEISEEDAKKIFTDD